MHGIFICVDMFTTKHAKSFTSICYFLLFLNRPNNVSTAVPDEYVCLSAIDALLIANTVNAFYLKKNATTACFIREDDSSRMKQAVVATFLR